MRVSATVRIHLHTLAHPSSRKLTEPLPDRVCSQPRHLGIYPDRNCTQHSRWAQPTQQESRLTDVPRATTRTRSTRTPAGGHVHEPVHPRLERSLQQHLSADDVGGHEVGGALNRTVDV